MDDIDSLEITEALFFSEPGKCNRMELVMDVILPCCGQPAYEHATDEEFHKDPGAYMTSFEFSLN